MKRQVVGILADDDAREQADAGLAVRDGRVGQLGNGDAALLPRERGEPSKPQRMSTATEAT